jgi:hypothetical protein
VQAIVEHGRVDPRSRRGCRRSGCGAGPGAVSHPGCGTVVESSTKTPVTWTLLSRRRQFRRVLHLVDQRRDIRRGNGRCSPLQALG